MYIMENFVMDQIYVPTFMDYVIWIKSHHSFLLIMSSIMQAI